MLLVTGYADAVATGAGPMGGGVQVMAKPFTVGALAARVEGIINAEAIEGREMPVA